MKAKTCVSLFYNKRKTIVLKPVFSRRFSAAVRNAFAPLRPQDHYQSQLQLANRVASDQDQTAATKLVLKYM